MIALASLAILGVGFRGLLLYRKDETKRFQYWRSIVLMCIGAAVWLCSGPLITDDVIHLMNVKLNTDIRFSTLNDILGEIVFFWGGVTECYFIALFTAWTAKRVKTARTTEENPPESKPKDEKAVHNH